MTNGLNIGTHHFNYLTSSNSQAKQGSGWYFNLEFTKYENIEKVLEEMGNFKQEQNKYKNASRRGQCASSTTPINFLPKENIIEIPDIKSSDNKYIYTDGIGTISYNLAMKCVEKIGNNKFSYCSAFQIRLLGIKGVVAVDPNLADKDIICIRPSMKKYESENNELGIIKASGYSTGYLNRQIISLLNGLGVRNNIFISIIKVSLKEYQTIIKYIRNKSIELSSYFRANKDVYNEVLSKCFYFKSVVDYYLFKRHQRYLPNEPFIQKILLNCLSIKIRDLKSKGKIMDKQSAS
jgi:RNA-dependent RNA polymerase